MASPADLTILLDQGRSIAQEAAASLKADNSRRVTQELRRDVKIVADQRLHEIILKSLQEKSSYPVLSEEGRMIPFEEINSSYYWIVDPVDGSLNFSRQIPLCCISIGLWKGMEPVLGVIYDFNRDELFSGLVGNGAWLNGYSIQVSPIQADSEKILCTGFPVATNFSLEGLTSFIKQIQNYKKVRLLGSAALSLAYVASGRVDAYQENSIALWDVGAGLALVKAAGGHINYRQTQTAMRFAVKAWNI